MELKNSNKINGKDFPKISVVMTAYNGEQYIRQAIESILNQTFKDFDFIIVDDGSSDKTTEIILSFNDPRIVFIKNPRNLGQTKSLNIGIRKSRADYIARMDADDIAHPQRLQIQYDYLESHLDIAIVGSWTTYIDKNSKPFRFFKTPTNPTDIKCFLLGSGDLSFWSINHPTVLIRHQVFEAVGLYSEEKGEIQGYPQDYELWSKLLPKYKFANIAQPLLQYRILKRSDSRKFALDQLHYRFEISLRKIKLFLPGLKDQDAKILAHMLEFRPQMLPNDGMKVLDLFDQYFDTAMVEEKTTDKVKEIKNRMKFYYLPQLFMTNKLLTVRIFFHCLYQYPLFIFDIKFYQKIFKAGVFNMSLKSIMIN